MKREVEEKSKQVLRNAAKAGQGARVRVTKKG